MVTKEALAEKRGVTTRTMAKLLPLIQDEDRLSEHLGGTWSPVQSEQLSGRGGRILYDEQQAHALLDELEKRGFLRAGPRWKGKHQKPAGWAPSPFLRDQGCNTPL